MEARAPGRAEQLDLDVLVDLRVAGPGGVELERAAVVEAQQGAREVLHLERVRAGGGDAVRAPSAAGAADLAVRDRRDAGHARLVEQVQRDVEHVGAEVDQRAAAGELLAGEPGADAGDAGAPLPARAGVVDVAQRRVVEVVAEEGDVGAAAVVVRDLEHPVVRAGGLDHLGRQLGGGGERLLAEDVLAARERGHGDRVVQVVRDADGDDVEVVAGDELLPVGVEVGDAAGRAEFVQARLLLAG
nr:hypothetical protein [Rathayibacter sp. AY1D1]